MTPHRFLLGFPGRLMTINRVQSTNGNPHTANGVLAQKAPIFRDNFFLKKVKL